MTTVRLTFVDIFVKNDICKYCYTNKSLISSLRNLKKVSLHQYKSFDSLQMNNEKDMIMIYTVIASNLYPILEQFKNATVLKSPIKQ